MEDPPGLFPPSPGHLPIPTTPLVAWHHLWDEIHSPLKQWPRFCEKSYTRGEPFGVKLSNAAEAQKFVGISEKRTPKWSFLCCVPRLK